MYEYKVTSPILPPRDKRRTPDSPLMDGQAKEWKCPECGVTYVGRKPVKCAGCKTPAT